MHADAALSRDTPQAAPARRCRVLLVEDSARLAASIRDYLERHSFEVFIEGDGLAGNDAARQRAEKMAAAVKGVKEVRNFLAVKQG